MLLLGNLECKRDFIDWENLASSLTLSLSLSLSLESDIDLIDRFFSATKHSDIVNFNGTLRKKKKKGELLYSPLVNSLGLGFDFIFDIKF